MALTTATGNSCDTLFDDRKVSSLQWLVFVLCGVVAAFDGFDIQSIAYAAPAIGAELNIPQENFGLIFSAGIVGMFVGLLIQGQIADRVGRKPMILVTVTIFGVATLATSFASTTAELVGARFFCGTGMGAALPNIIALSSEYAPHRLRSRLVVAMNSGLPIGGLIGGVISAPMIEVLGWRSIFILGGVGPLILVVILYRLLPESPSFLATRNDERSRARLASLFDRLDILPFHQDIATEKQTDRPKLLIAGLFRDGRMRNTVLISLVFLANMLLFYFMIGWMPTLLTESGLEITQAVLITAGVNLGTVIGGLALGWLVDKQGASITLFGTYLLASALFAFLGAVTKFDMIALAAIIATLGLCIGGAQLVINALAADLFPAELRSSGVGFAFLAGRLGAVIGSSAGGPMLAYGLTVNQIYWVLAGPCAFAAACAIFILVPRRT